MNGKRGEKEKETPGEAKLAKISDGRTEDRGVRRLVQELHGLKNRNVFFRAGVVAHIEDLRDARLSQLVTGFQAVCRWHCAKFDVAHRHKQISAYRLIQSNIRAWLQLRTWPWFKLYSRARPLCVKGKAQQELEKVQETYQMVQESLQREQELTEKKWTRQVKLALSKRIDFKLRTLADELHKQELTESKLAKERKQQQELAAKLQNDLQMEAERNAAEKAHRQKLQQTLESVENEMDRERRARAEQEKARRKFEGEVRIARENLDEMGKQRQDMETSLKRKEADLLRCPSEMDARCKEMEAELEAERQARARSERGRGEIQYEADELQERLEQQAQATQSQIEANKKKDAEVAKLRREIDQLKLTFESQATALKSNKLGKKRMDKSEGIAVIKWN
ncbi:hypothetical protein niasHS_005627 [Heterodera schachtii]|uniref:Myosin heavy chain n=1 Tax=Heterodera schachtii TaxID=97005 RepID=A0ABD2JZ57_HETSC